MSYDSYHIPTNFTDAGRLFGVFEIRNTIETVILTAPIIYLSFLFVPFELSKKVIFILVIIVPVGGFGLIGISDDSLSRWAQMWWRWRKNRRQIHYRGEVKQ